MAITIILILAGRAITLACHPCIPHSYQNRQPNQSTNTQTRIYTHAHGHTHKHTHPHKHTWDWHQSRHQYIYIYPWAEGQVETCGTDSMSFNKSMRSNNEPGSWRWVPRCQRKGPGLSRSYRMALHCTWLASRHSCVPSLDPFEATAWHLIHSSKNSTYTYTNIYSSLI